MPTPTPTPDPPVSNLAETRSYYDGCRDAVVRFAVWRDGKQYVGAIQHPLSAVLAEIAEAEDRLESFRVGA